MALIAHTSIPSTSSYGSTSPNVDTTGVKFIAVVVGAYTNGGLTTGHLTFVDNYGNTYTGRTIYNGTVPWCRIFYCNNPTVGTGHNWGFGGGQPYYPSACIAGFDDTVTGFDVENGGVSSGTQTSKATGSATPTTSNSLAIAGFNPCDNGAGTITVNGSFTITDQVVWASGQREGSALAYLYTTATSALNPTFTIPTASTQGLGAAIAVFKLASSGSTLSASGTGAASFVGASTAATTLTSAGTGALSVVGASTAKTTLSASGTGALTGIGASKANATLTASGTGAFTGVGASTASATLTSAGTGSFSAVGASLASAVATMAGTATASFVGAVASAGSILTAAGTSAFSAVGASLASAIATFTGTSTATFLGPSNASTFTMRGRSGVVFWGGSALGSIISVPHRDGARFGDHAGYRQYSQGRFAHSEILGTTWTDEVVDGDPWTPTPDDSNIWTPVDGA